MIHKSLARMLSIKIHQALNLRKRFKVIEFQGIHAEINGTFAKGKISQIKRLFFFV